MNMKDACAAARVYMMKQERIRKENALIEAGRTACIDCGDLRQALRQIRLECEYAFPQTDAVLRIADIVDEALKKGEKND